MVDASQFMINNNLIIMNDRHFIAAVDDNRNETISSMEQFNKMTERRKTTREKVTKSE